MVREKGPWELFLTMTFRVEKGEQNAKRCFKCVLKYINEPGDVYYQKIVHAFIVLEQDTNRDTVHIHSFIRGIDPSRAVSLQNKIMDKLCWKNKCAQDKGHQRKPKIVTGQTVVRPYDPELGGDYYLGWKYPFSKMVDYDFIKINSRFREQ